MASHAAHYACWHFDVESNPFKLFSGRPSCAVKQIWAHAQLLELRRSSAPSCLPAIEESLSLQVCQAYHDNIQEEWIHAVSIGDARQLHFTQQHDPPPCRCQITTDYYSVPCFPAS